MSLLPIWDILIQELEGVISNSMTDPPQEYWFKTIQPLLMIEPEYEHYQVYWIENYLINIKRSLLFLIGYVRDRIHSLLILTYR